MTCDFRPFPGSGAYGHWTCGRRRLHIGRHRFNNYTVPRVPRVWRLRRLVASFRVDQRLRRINDGKRGYGYRRALFPTRYDPVT
jgi:hypothetical protein